MKQLYFQGISIPNGDDFYAVGSCDMVPTGNYYFLSNDVHTLRLSIKGKMDDAVICGVANPHFFHIISLIAKGAPVKRVIAVDSNYDQLLHFNRIYTLILNSNNRIEFLQRLFMVIFNAKAIRILQDIHPSPENIVRGGVDKDPFFRLEKTIWDNLCFNAREFHDTYGLNAISGEGGLKIQSSTVGDINSYYATILCCARSDYEYWPFSAAFGSGFLRSEESFRQMQQILRFTPIYMLHADLAEVYFDLLMSNRYHSQYVWCSNLLCDYFVKKYPGLMRIVDLSKCLGTQGEPCFPEIDLVLLQDDRTRLALPKTIDNIRNRCRTWSVHTRNFSKICKYLRGTSNLEIISERSWFEQDKGISKLPNTNYIMVDDFLSSNMNSTFDSVVVHILMGHGMAKEKYEQVLLKSYSLSKNLIILEHNRQSKDFRQTNIGITINEIRDILGMESITDYGPGSRCDNRNLILVYLK